MKKNLSAWDISISHRPMSLQDALRLSIGYAILSPSAHNSQPWKFVVHKNTITIKLDESSTIGLSDPDNKLAYMSLGCAVSFLQICLKHLGVAYIREGLTFTASHLMDKGVEQNDFESISRRRSNRFSFTNEPIPQEKIDILKSINIPDGVQLHFITDKNIQNNINKVTTEATRAAYRDITFRQELAHYLRPNITHRYDGMPGYVVGAPTLLSLVASFVVKTFDIGKQEAETTSKLIASAPLLIMATSATDDSNAWVSTGEALGNFILRAQSLGLQAGWYAAPIVINPIYRQQSQNILNTQNHPQMLLRVGYPSKIQKPTPRKPLENVIFSD